MYTTRHLRSSAPPGNLPWLPSKCKLTTMGRTASCEQFPKYAQIHTLMLLSDSFPHLVVWWSDNLHIQAQQCVATRCTAQVLRQIPAMPAMSSLQELDSIDHAVGLKNTAGCTWRRQSAPAGRCRPRRRAKAIACAAVPLKLPVLSSGASWRDRDLSSSCSVSESDCSSWPGQRLCRTLRVHLPQRCQILRNIQLHYSVVRSDCSSLPEREVLQGGLYEFPVALLSPAKHFTWREAV